MLLIRKGPRHLKSYGNTKTQLRREIRGSNDIPATTHKIKFTSNFLSSICQNEPF